jgi:hypothetical protein
MVPLIIRLRTGALWLRAVKENKLRITITEKQKIRLKTEQCMRVIENVKRECHKNRS